MWVFFLYSLDKELVRLAEKHAREREQREKQEREQREREAQEQKLAPIPPPNQIQVKPIIETTSSTQHGTQSRKSYGKLFNGDHDTNKTEDLLRLVNNLKKKQRIYNSFFFFFFQDLLHHLINNHHDHQM